MTDEEYKKAVQIIKREYIAGHGTQQSLCKKYGIPRNTIAKIAARDGWSDLKNKAATRAEQKVVESVAAAEASNAIRMAKLWEKFADRVEASIGNPDLTPKGIESISNALEKLQKGLGVRDPLEEEEKRARIAKLRKEVEAVENNQTGGIVIDLGGAEAWAK